MKTTLKLAVIGALMVMGAAQTKAATTVPKTIWAQPLNFKLTAWEDGQAKPVAITTKSIISDLAGLVTPSGIATNPASFSTGSQLLHLEDTTTSNQVFVVRDPKTKVDTDVTEFISVNGGDSVSFTATNGKTTTKHSITSFTFVGISTLNFTVTGITTETKTLENGDDVIKSASADVSGTGLISTGIFAVINGSVSVGGGHLEAPK